MKNLFLGRAELPLRPNLHQNKQSDVLATISANVPSIANGEVRAERQLRPTFLKIACVLVLVLFATASLRAQTEWLEKVDQSLFLQSSNGFFRTDLSGLLDVEGYYVDQRGPGLLFSDHSFVNPRATFFIDTRIGKHFYSLVQARIDRGFDPHVKDIDARFDEYLLRYTPFDDARLNLQIGKFATVIGNYVPRHDSWHNSFVTAPLPYENVFTMTDQAAPPSAKGFLSRKGTPDKKTLWVPLVWGPSYTSGASVFGSIEKFDYALEFKNASISSRPAVWDAYNLGWGNPTVSGRIGFRPSAAWNLGISASEGAYLLPAARSTLPPGKRLGDFNQFTIAQDASFAWRHLQVWGEIFFSRFEVPRVGDADTCAYYLEAKYKFTPKIFGALRWNQQFFGGVKNGSGGTTAWDNDVWRIDSALGYRFDRHLQAKLQYSYSHQKGTLQQGEQLVAAQMTIKF